MNCKSYVFLNMSIFFAALGGCSTNDGTRNQGRELYGFAGGAATKLIPAGECPNKPGIYKVTVRLRDDFFNHFGKGLCEDGSWFSVRHACIIERDARPADAQTMPGTPIDLDLYHLVKAKRRGTPVAVDVTLVLPDGSKSDDHRTKVEFLTQYNDPDTQDDVYPPNWMDPTHYTIQEGFRTPNTVSYSCRSQITTDSDKGTSRISYRVTLLPGKHDEGHVNIAILVKEYDSLGDLISQTPIILDPSAPNKGQQ